jgi:hypothetical protein
MMGKNSGFLMMILSVLGVVLYVTMFSNILDAFDTLGDFATISSYIAMSTVVSIAPTVLFLAGVLGAGAIYVVGYKKAASAGTNGLLLMVMGALEIILFVTLFSTIMTAMEVLRTTSSVVANDYIAFGTVVTIAPTVLFLAGIFAGAATAVAGYKSRKGQKGLMG